MAIFFGHSKSSGGLFVILKDTSVVVRIKKSLVVLFVRVDNKQ